jgi:hypothetical protein
VPARSGTAIEFATIGLRSAVDRSPETGEPVGESGRYVPVTSTGVPFVMLRVTLSASWL